MGSCLGGGIREELSVTPLGISRSDFIQMVGMWWVARRSSSGVSGRVWRAGFISTVAASAYNSSSGVAVRLRACNKVKLWLLFIHLFSFYKKFLFLRLLVLNY